MAETRQEHSAGGVVYKQVASESGQITVKYLLGKHSGYHKWVLPKGLVEKGETPTQAAVREVKEEMGVEAKIVGNKPIKTIEYSYMAVPADKKRGSRIKQPERRVQTYQENADFKQTQGKVRVKKQVDFYLMKWVTGDPKDHDWEMEAAGWYEFDEAIVLMGFATEREVLQKAQQIISS